MRGDFGIGSFVFFYILKGHTNEMDFRCFDVNCWSLSIWKSKSFNNCVRDLCRIYLNPTHWYVPLKGGSPKITSPIFLFASLSMRLLKIRHLVKFATYVCDGQIIVGGGGGGGWGPP